MTDADREARVAELAARYAAGLGLFADEPAPPLDPGPPASPPRRGRKPPPPRRKPGTPPREREAIRAARAKLLLAMARDVPGVAVRHDDAADTVTVSVTFRAAEEAALTPCERDLLAVVRGRDPYPVTTTRVLAELERRGRLHGQSTVVHALASLARRGWLRSSRRAPRGYTLPRSAQ